MSSLFSPDTESAQTQRKVQDAWGRHLGEFDWTHWVTLTSRFADTTARHLQRQFQDRFIRQLAWHVQRPVPWFAATERGAAGLIHIHGLIYADLPLERVRSLWELGRADVKTFDPDGGAPFYLAKTLHLPDDQFERVQFSRRLPPRLIRAA